MRAVSPELAAAITSPERIIRHLLRVDWDDDGFNGTGSIDDLTDNVATIKSTQQLQTQLPEQVRVVPGAAAAQLDVEFGRGNLIAKQVDVDVLAQTSAKGSGTAISIPAPTNAPDDVILLFCAYANASLPFPDLPKGGNVAWTLLAIRGESQPVGSFTERVEAFVLIRRAAAGEPANYTFTANQSINWCGSAVSVGNPGIAGLHAYVSNGQESDNAPYSSRLTTDPVAVTLPGSAVVSFLAGWLPSGRGQGTQTSDPGYTVAFSSTTLAQGNLWANVVYQENLAVGNYAPALIFNPNLSNFLHANYDVEVDLSGWGGPGHVGTITRSNDRAHRGSWSVKAVANGSSSSVAAVTDRYAVTIGQQYTISAWVYSATGANIEVGIDWWTAANVFISISSSTVAVPAGVWTYIQATGAAPATTATGSGRARIGGTPAAGVTFYVDQLMIKLGTTAADVDTRTDAGFTVALAPALAGDDGQHAAWTFSELNGSSPYAGKTRFGRRVNWIAEFATSNGFQQVPIFTGLSLDAAGSARSRSATLRAIDNRETWRDPVKELPDILAEHPNPFSPTQPRLPGLESTYLISWLFAFGMRAFEPSGAYRPEQAGPIRGYGYFASPFFRNGPTMVHAPMHGSCEAWAGQCEAAWTVDGGKQRRVKFDVGPYVAATEAPTGTVTAVNAWYSTGGSTSIHVVATSQSAGRIEYAAKLLPGSSSTVGVSVQNWISPTTQRAQLNITSARVLNLQLNAPAATSRLVVGPTLPNDGAWHWVGVHWNSVTGSATFMIDGVNTVVAFSTWSNAATVTDQIYDVVATTAAGGQIAELHACGGVVTNIGDAGTIALADPWIQTGFVPSAFIDKSDNLLDGVLAVPIDDDAWDIASDIAEAEFAALFWDADGRPHFRTVRSDQSTTGQTVQKVITAAASLKEIDYVSGVTQIRNAITVPYQPIELHIAEKVSVDGKYRVPANGSLTIKFAIQGRQMFGLGAESVTIATTNKNPDGTGTAVTTGYTVSWGGDIGGTTGSITVDNSNAFDIWLVDSSGNNTIVALLSWIQSGAAGSSLAEGVDSIRTYRRQPVAVSGSIWRQRSDSAAAIAARILADLQVPRATVRNVKIVGDPRLEIGDLVQIVDRNGLGIDGKFRITGLAPSGTARGGFEQTLTARGA